jgi:RecB family exonuclease
MKRQQGELTSAATTAAHRMSTDGPPVSGTPAERAMAITGRNYFSWSQANRYSTCPRAFEFQYVLREPPAFVPSSLAFGIAFHDAVARVAQADLEGAPRPSVEEMVPRLSDELRRGGAPLRLGNGESLESLTALASRMLAAYLESPESQVQGTPICIEDVARGIVDSSVPPIEARVDLAYQRSDGSLVVRDIKTTRSKWSADKVSESAPQLRLYAMLLDTELEGVGRVESLEFLTVTKAAKPVVQLHQLPARNARSDGRDAMVEQLQEIWHGIEAGVFPARPSWACRQCPYSDRCSAAIGCSS